MPPSPNIPAGIKDLTAVQRGTKIEVAFHTPPRTTDNMAIKKFSEIELRIGPPNVPFDFETWAAGATEYSLTPPPAGDPLDPKPLPMSTSVAVDSFVGQRVLVAVRTAIRPGDDHYSSWSNRVFLEIVPAVATPSNIKIAASAEGVVLDWPPVKAADSYRILRQAAGENTLTEIGTSKTPHFLDTTSQFDVAYLYQVIALNSGAESLPSDLLSITPVDTFPPSVPSNVAALAGPESVEVSWQRSPEADTAGYYVYRSTDGGAFERQGDIVTLPAFSDRKVEHGKTYRYQISAVDQKKNESERSPAVEVGF